MKLSERTILITGGNSGIGMALVKALVLMDNSVMIISRSRNHWDELEKISHEIRTFQCDVTDKKQLLELRNTLHQEKVQLDLVINCAALQLTPKLTDKDFSFDGVQTEILTNIAAPVWLSYLSLSLFAEHEEAAIVNLSSGLAFYPKSSSAVYCASKAALHNFSQSLRYQLTNTPIKVIEVILPLVDTPMTQGRGKNKISATQAAAEIIAGIERDTDEIYVGKARLIPPLMRIAPGLLKRMLARH